MCVLLASLHAGCMSLLLVSVYIGVVCSREMQRVLEMAEDIVFHCSLTCFLHAQQALLDLHCACAFSVPICVRSAILRALFLQHSSLTVGAA